MKKRLSMLLVCLLCVALLTSATAEVDLDLPTDALGPEGRVDAPVLEGMPEVGLDLNLAGLELESAEPTPNIGFLEPNADDVPVDAAHFPDDSFRSFVSSRFDGDFDGMLSENERNLVFEIDASMQGIEDLAGIEWFPNLNRLFCYSNGISAPLDVRGNTRLQRLDCSYNSIPALKLGDCPDLTALCCEGNDLTALDVSGCPALTMLHCEHNYISSLDITRCEALHPFARVAPVILSDGTACFGVAEADSGDGYRIAIDPSTVIIIDGEVVYGKQPESLEKAKVTAKDQVYSGKAKKPAVTVTLNGKTLKKGADYTVRYSNNVNIGRATVTVTGTGDYVGKAKGSFVIKPKAVSKLTLKPGKNKLAVSWKKGVGGVGYELQYSLKKSFAGAKKVKISKTATVKRTLKGLKAGKTYYVRIRARKKVNGTTYYSAWSGAKSAKVK